MNSLALRFICSSLVCLSFVLLATLVENALCNFTTIRACLQDAPVCIDPGFLL